MHKSQIFFWLLLSFLSGIFVASIFSARGGSASGEDVGPAFIYTGLITAIGLIGVFGYDKSFNGKLILAGFLGVAFLFGVIRFNSANFDQGRLDVFTGREAGEKGVEVVVNGFVDDETVVKGNRSEMILRAKELVAGDRTVRVDDRIMITANRFPKFDYGDAVSATGALRKPTNLGEFDYVAYLKKEGIRTTMFYPDVVEYPGFELGWSEKLKINVYKAIFSAKRSFESAVSKSVSEPNASFINGILLGSRQNIPDDLKESFNKTGTTHILAISGYNIMIISWAVLTGLVIFLRRRTAFWISVAVICLFVILTGASASVVRAAVMGLLLLFAQGYGRLYDPKNSIILAGAAMVYFNPLVLRFNVGFQLSFLAVLGLIYFAPILKEKLSKAPELFGVKEMGIMTISAQLFVLPLLLNQFNVFSTVSLPANILVLPLVPAAMLFGFLAGAGGLLFAPLGQLFGYFAWAVTSYQLGVIKFFASMSFSSYDVSIHWLTMAVAYVLLFVWTYKLSKRAEMNK
ncbi:MAG TPA: ComEC/Rec2 family competence protein [Candidatus Paceibacterota bacterium]|nr:ComEC/Rec2 family competence protein [Candidatus Paceibacterota bacterium]